MRPSYAVVPQPGQISVWDFPRPPRLEPVGARVRVEHGGTAIADTLRALRVCETASPPTYYLPMDDIVPGVLVACPGGSWCEWKGRAVYWTLRTASGDIVRAAWSYSNPSPGFEALRPHVAFYASRVEACWVGEDRVVPQPGEFYGGWVTPDLTGPFKGEPGTGHW